MEMDILRFTNENGKLIRKDSSGNKISYKTTTNERRPTIGVQTVTKFCSGCGVDISYKVSDRAYECEKCQRKKWNAGSKRRAIYRNTSTHKLLDKSIYILYDHRCAICGWRAREKRFLNPSGIPTKTFGCELHHIIAVKDGGVDTLENTIILCPNHHKECNLGLMSKEEVRKYQVPTLEIEQRLQVAREHEDTGRLGELVKAHKLLDDYLDSPIEPLLKPSQLVEYKDVMYSKFQKII